MALSVGFAFARFDSGRRCAGNAGWCNTSIMDIEQWWPKLSDATREWLIANNGDAVPERVVSEIVAAGGVLATESEWVGENGPDGFFLSDEATDWIEAAANDEY